MKPAVLAHLSYCSVIALLIAATRHPPLDSFRPAISRMLGTAAYHLSARKRKAAEAGVSTCCNLPTETRNRIVRESFRFFWEELFTIAPSRSDRALVKSASVRGRAGLEAALQRGKGAILLESNSFGYRSLAKQALADLGVPIIQVHADRHFGGIRNAHPVESGPALWLRRVFERWELDFVERVVRIPSSPTLAYGREFQRILARNGILCSAGDGTWGEKLIRIPFLGGHRDFPAGIASLSRLTGAALIPLVATRNHAHPLEIILGDPVEPGTREADRPSPGSGIDGFARFLESWIMRYPGCYRNWQGLAQTQVRSPKTPHQTK